MCLPLGDPSKTAPYLSPVHKPDLSCCGGLLQALTALPKSREGRLSLSESQAQRTQEDGEVPPKPLPSLGVRASLWTSAQGGIPLCAAPVPLGGHSKLGDAARAGGTFGTFPISAELVPMPGTQNTFSFGCCCDLPEWALGEEPAPGSYSKQQPRLTCWGTRKLQAIFWFALHFWQRVKRCKMPSFKEDGKKLQPVRPGKQPFREGLLRPSL